MYELLGDFLSAGHSSCSGMFKKKKSIPSKLCEEVIVNDVSL